MEKILIEWTVKLPEDRQAGGFREVELDLNVNERQARRWVAVVAMDEHPQWLAIEVKTIRRSA